MLSSAAQLPATSLHPACAPHSTGSRCVRQLCGHAANTRAHRHAAAVKLRPAAQAGVNACMAAVPSPAQTTAHQHHVEVPPRLEKLHNPGTPQLPCAMIHCTAQMACQLDESRCSKAGQGEGGGAPTVHCTDAAAPCKAQAHEEEQEEHHQRDVGLENNGGHCSQQQGRPLSEISGISSREGLSSDMEHKECLQQG